MTAMQGTEILEASDELQGGIAAAAISSWAESAADLTDDEICGQSIEAVQSYILTASNDTSPEVEQPAAPEVSSSAPKV